LRTFEEFGPDARIYCYDVRREGVETLLSGKTKLAAAHIKIRSEITTESADMSFGVVHLEDHIMAGGVRDFAGEAPYHQMLKEMTDAFGKGDFTELVRVVDRSYGGAGNPLTLLFRDEQRKIVRRILESALREADTAYRELFEDRAPLMHFLAAMNFPPVKAFQVAAEFTLNADFRGALEENGVKVERARSILDEMNRIGVAIDSTTAEFALRSRLEQIAEQFRKDPSNLELLRRLNMGVELARSVPFQVQFWKVQNTYYDLLKNVYPDVYGLRTMKPPESDEWIQSFRKLGDELSFQID
jgi:hypothetical protein